MKSINYKILGVVLTMLFSVSCSEEFLENEVEDAIVDSNFFQTDDQIKAASNPLYGRNWFFYNDKFRWAMGDSYGGNAVGSFDDLAQFVNFSMNSDNEFMIEGWESYWVVITTANNLLEAIESKAGPQVSEEAKNLAAGEAKFMRAVAYFHLVRLWGPVPILENVTIDTSELLVRNTVESIYKFIERDLKEAIELLPTRQEDTRRVGKTAAWAYLAKMYLTLKDYPNAQLYAEKVIGSGEHSLEPTYHDQFINPDKSQNNESIFSLQWFVNCTLWGMQNTNQSYFAASGEITKSGDGWGTCVPSIDLLNTYEAGDARKRWTVMDGGSFYDELDTANGGFQVPATGLTDNIAAFRKYVVGSPDEYPGRVCQLRTDIHTHMMRYAEVLLIQAEAILGNSFSTTDGAALSAYNSIRRRANLAEKTVITLDDILKERRLELALESKYWFDLQRIDRAKAIQIIENQERGTVTDRSDPTQIESKRITPKESDFLFPIPSAEASFIAPGEPVDYFATN